MCNECNMSRHGVRQLRTGWADGPAYITQCPIGKGKTYTYNFTVVDQRGTLWWHAHFAWQRASVYGAFIIYPRAAYPFSPTPIIDTHIPIIFGKLSSHLSYSESVWYDLKMIMIMGIIEVNHYKVIDCIAIISLENQCEHHLRKVE